ncbi:MAG: hypothetical protein WD425_01830 [Nitrospirales bacterium]
MSFNLPLKDMGHHEKLAEMEALWEDIARTACSQILIPFSYTLEFIKWYTVIAVASPSGSRLQSITAWMRTWFSCMPYWIAAKIRCGSGND